MQYGVEYDPSIDSPLGIYEHGSGELLIAGGATQSSIKGVDPNLVASQGASQGGASASIVTVASGFPASNANDRLERKVKYIHNEDADKFFGAHPDIPDPRKDLALGNKVPGSAPVNRPVSASPTKL